MTAAPLRRVPPSSGLILFVAYTTLSVALYALVRGYTPITLNTRLVHDDTSFMQLGEYLAAGEWLGPYTQFTLMKGPGFPLFLAAVHWLGLSVSLAVALFHGGAVTLFVLVCRRFVGSTSLSALLLTVLLWHPIGLSLFVLRVFREDIYATQVILFTAAMVGALFTASRLPSKIAFALLAGLSLGWFWLTREEGAWVVPALVFLIAAAAVFAYRQREVARYVLTALIIGATFAGVQVGFRAINASYYGMFVGVDFLETNLTRALGAIHSVRSGEILPFISITRKARAAVYKVSPAFASLRDYFEGSSGSGWARISCDAQGTSCEEIGAGHFIWALRDAASLKGHYVTPAAASEFFGKIADEIEAACVRGALTCVRQPIAEIPPVTAEVIRDNLTAGLIFRAVNTLLMLAPPRGITPSDGGDSEYARYMAFLNYPLIETQRVTPLVSDVEPIRQLTGWYHVAGAAWVDISVIDAEGFPVDIEVDRRGSPDVVAATGDRLAARQRFIIRTQCPDDCVLRAASQTSGAKAEATLAYLRATAPTNLKIGAGEFQVDGVAIDPFFVKPWAESVAAVLRSIDLRFYQLIFVPVVALGVTAFFAATFGHSRRALGNVCYAIAATCWLLALSRVGLLVVMSVTSVANGAGLLPHYMSPAYFQFAAALVLSIAAWWQLASSAPRRRAATRPSF